MNQNEICADNEHETFIAEVFDGNESEWRANARFIVRACNAYDDLLLACKMGLQDAQDALSGKWQPTDEGWQSTIEHLTRVIHEAEHGKAA